MLGTLKAVDLGEDCNRGERDDRADARDRFQSFNCIAPLACAITSSDPCIFTSALQDGSEPGRGRPKDPWSQEAGRERGSPRPLSQVKARTVAGAAERARIMQGRVRPEKAGVRMEGEVMVGIDVSKPDSMSQCCRAKRFSVRNMMRVALPH